MSYNGSGTFLVQASGNPVVAGTTISSTWANGTLNELATGLSTAICKDGQTTTTAQIPFASGLWGPDSSVLIKNASDLTKIAKFSAAALTTGTTRTYTLPDTSDTLVTLAATQALTNKTISGLTVSTTTGTLTIANGKTLTANSSLTLAGTDGKTLTANASLTLAGTDGKTLTLSNSLTLAGTDGTTMTFPGTSASVARTDAAQTFTGTQTFSSTIAGSVTGNAATVSTNANLTGPITSVGNATAVAAQTGTGSTFVMQAGPSFTGAWNAGVGAWVGGTPASITLTNATGTAASLTAGNATSATTATNLAGGGAGQLPYQSGSGATSMLAAGVAGQILQSNGTSAPSWADNAVTGLSVGWDWGQGAGYGGFSAGGTPAISTTLNWASDGSIQIQSDGTNSAWLGTSTNATSPSTLIVPFALANNPTLNFNACTISGGTSNRWVGFMTTVNFASDPAEGFGFRWANSGNYFAVVRHGSADSLATDTGIAISTSTYHEFKIVVSGGGTLITFYIDGVSKATYSSTMPTGPFGLAAYTETAAGGGARLRYLRATQTTR